MATQRSTSGAGTEQRTPDIASVIQEIVNQSGWQSGNSLAVILTGTDNREAESYDGNPDAAAVLHVEYLINRAYEFIFS